MELKNITQGKVIKNYKEFCELVEEMTKGGKSKQLQLIDWERHLSYKKDGNKFIIIEIYETPSEKIDNREGGNHSIYGDYIKKSYYGFIST